MFIYLKNNFKDLCLWLVTDKHWRFRKWLPLKFKKWCYRILIKWKYVYALDTQDFWYKWYKAYPAETVGKFIDLVNQFDFKDKHQNLNKIFDYAIKMKNYIDKNTFSIGK